MHPTGIEPALKASEASVLSIRLQVQNITKLLRQWLSYHIFRILSSKRPFQNVSIQVKNKEKGVSNVIKLRKLGIGSSFRAVPHAGVPINKLSNARTSKVCIVCSIDTVPNKLKRGRMAQGFA